MSGGDQKNSVSISQLAKEIKTLNSPVQQRSKALFAQISGLNSSIEKKIQECDRFCDSDQLKQLDGLFERSIELLKDFKQRQQTLIKQLKTDNTQGNKKDMWKNIGAKVDQVQLEVNNLIASMPLLDKIVTIELQIKKLEDICDEL